ncbi:MAG: hypothetical protein LBJ64_00205 [Deltaproteobacteria bacterium]|jgi:hypothetical protein|nr:hypothetical protein [Deltaproteobacteria bacterium]
MSADNNEIKPEGCLGCLGIIAIGMAMVIAEKLGFTGIQKIPSLLQIFIPSVFIFVAILVVVVHMWNLKNGRPKDFVTFILSLIFAYGFIAFALPGVADDFVPTTWQWPTTSEPQVLVLDDGCRVTTLKSVVRIQVYDSSGKYLNGWYAPFSTNRMEILGTGPDHGWGEDRNTILVAPGGKNFLLFDPDGRIIMEKPRPEKIMPVPEGAL